MAGGLLVEHACLDDLLIHIEFVFGSCQDFFLHTVDGAETEHAHLVLLTDAVSPVLSLEVLESKSSCLDIKKETNEDGSRDNPRITND